MKHSWFCFDFSKKHHTNQIIKAIRESDLNTIEKHIQKYKNFSVQYYEKGLNQYYPYPMVVIAAENNKFDVLDFLIKKGADINEATFQGQLTALMIAVKNDNVDMVNYLIQSGADVNKRWIFGETPILFACEVGDIELVKLLQKSNANISSFSEKGRDCNAFMKAFCWRPNIELIKYLLTTEATLVINTEDSWGHNALTRACWHASLGKNVKEYTDIAHVLVEKGAITKNSLDIQGFSALYYAIQSGSLPLVKLLINHGASLNITNKRGDSALAIAANFKYEDIVAFIEESQSIQNTYEYPKVNVTR